MKQNNMNSYIWSRDVLLVEPYKHMAIGDVDRRPASIIGRLLFKGLGRSEGM